MGFVSPLSAQKTFSVWGKVIDENGESLPGATIFIVEKQKGANANENGEYNIKLKPGKYTIECSYVGYNKQVKKIKLNGGDKKVNFYLVSTGVMIDEVQVTGTQDENVESVRISEISLNMKQINEIPQFLGEVDIIKTIQFLPGVSSATEGTSGFYVRGGSPDQNLILLDGSTIYNSSHLFGFFSIFNSTSVDDITLIKGGMPAKYGGRLSSVLEINQSSGSKTDWNVKGSIGTISSKISFGGPIIKNKMSFLFSARRTYIDILLAPIIPKSSSFSGSSYFFYDLNLKFDYQINKKNSIALSGYYGIDKFNFNNSDIGFNMQIPWGNAMASLQWLHTFNENFFIKTMVNYSHYEFSFIGSQNEFEFKLLSGINDFNFRSDGFYKLNSRNILRFGIQGTYHYFTPSSVSARSGETQFDTGDIQHMYGLETGAYISDEFDLSEKWKFYTGLRFSSFTQFGEFTRYIKDDLGSTVDSKYWGKGEAVVTYPRLEPRVSIRFKTTKNSSIKAAYTLNYQYIQLASISTVSLPTDVWIPSSDKIKPQQSQQFNLGYFFNFNKNMFEASVEGYYKIMNNLVEYAEGSEPSDDVNDNPDNQLVEGDGETYGIEFFLKKVTGKVNGWIGYTYSFSNRQFPDINDGNPYPAKYDRRHDVSVIVNYTINKKWQIGGAFVYATGNTITLPESRYVIEGRIVNEYGQRNSSRMSDFNRLDFTATFTPRNMKKKINPVTGEKEYVPRRFKSKWNFSIYNVYNQANPYFIFFENSVDSQKGTISTQAKQVSLFPILPAITWSFEF